MCFILQNYLMIIAILIGILGAYFPIRTEIKFPEAPKQTTLGDLTELNFKDYTVQINTKYGFVLILISFIIQFIAILYSDPIYIGRYSILLLVFYIIIALLIILCLYLKFNSLVETKIQEVKKIYNS